jgi:phosphoribosylglycinamide formyltransferase-1
MMAKAMVLASGSGSNFQAIAEALAAGGKHRVALLACDRKGAYAFQRAVSLGIPGLYVGYKDRTREEAEAEITAAALECGASVIALAGFMRLLTPSFVDQWEGRLVNIHPALLPRHPGTHGIEDSFASGDEELGISIHYVDRGMDSGEIILQKSFKRRPGMSLEDAAAEIHALEHRWYPDVVGRLLDGAERAENIGI